MPYFNHSEKKYIFDLKSYIPVTVTVNHARDGRFMPIYISYSDSDSTIHKIKIEAVKFTRDYHGYVMFQCIICIQNKRKEISLVYITNKHQCNWFMKYS